MTDSLQKLLQRKAIALFVEHLTPLRKILVRAEIDFTIENGDRIPLLGNAYLDCQSVYRNSHKIGEGHQRRLRWRRP